MGNSWFKISIIDGVLNICNMIEKYPECNIEDAIKELKVGPVSLSTYDYKKAHLLGELIGWDIFRVSGTRKVQLSEVLKRLVLHFEPFWARFSYLGRDKVEALLSADARQCLQIAGLLENPLSDFTVAWWDEISVFFRTKEENRKLQIGRDGEKKSINYEKIRLKNELIYRDPEWVSLVDNTAGYDIKSYRKVGETSITEIMIEVKASVYEPISFIITRNEWNKAKNNPNKYIFHIWSLDVNKLTIFTVEQLSVHIPIEQGKGEWEKVKVVL
jgi:hypothetical protein